MTSELKTIALIPKSKKEKTILLLEDIKLSINSLHKGNSLAFAANTLETVKKAVGENSNQYFSLNSLLTDDTAARMQRKITPSDILIVGKVKVNEENFIALIDSCIKQVNTFGLYKSPSEKKNFLSNIDNRFLWTLLGAFATLCFFLGKGYCKYDIENYINDEQIVSRKNVPQVVQQEKITNIQTFDSLHKSHTKLKPTRV